jgi:hypothetical protein
MKVRIPLMFFATLVFLGLGTTTQAQDKPEKETTHSNVRTIKGCLEKANGRDEYNLTAADGSTWEVRSDSAKLEEHVGQEVQVTGAVSNAAAHGAKEDAKNEAKEHGVDKNATEHGHLTATSVKKVSDRCGS